MTSELAPTHDAVVIAGAAICSASCLRFTYGSKKDWEVRLVASGVTFAWMQKENRIWKMMAMRETWTPAQVLDFLRSEDPKAETYLQFAGVKPETPNND